MVILSERHQESLNYALRVLKNSDLPISSIWLYGSCADGTAKYDSDVDLAVFLDGSSQDTKKIRNVKCDCMPLAADLPEVDIHVFGEPFENVDLSNVYFFNIKRGGVRIESDELL